MSVGLGRVDSYAEWRLQRPLPEQLKDINGLFDTASFNQLSNNADSVTPQYEVTQHFGDAVVFAQPGTIHSVAAFAGREALLLETRAKILVGMTAESARNLTVPEPQGV
jgi:hypothetical protein